MLNHLQVHLFVSQVETWKVHLPFFIETYSSAGSEKGNVLIHVLSSKTAIPNSVRITLNITNVMFTPH